MPIEARGAKGKPVLVTRDESVRADCTAETLAPLKPAFRPDGVVTAGNSSPMSDGGGAMAIVDRATAKGLGAEPLATFRGYDVAGVDPNIMGVGPVAAVAKLMKQTGLKVSDIDLWELNEAFATQSIACIREIGMDIKKVNPNWGAIAIGHPLAGSGAVLVARAVRELKRSSLRRAVVTFCVGGGQGVAILLEKD